MALVTLTASDRQWLRRVAQRTRDAREVRRARALLDLAGGERDSRVAARYGVVRSTVWEWAARWNDPDTPRAERLRDAERPGQRPVLRDAVARTLEKLMTSAPSAHGYRREAWTARLLAKHLARQEGPAASESTVLRAIHSLGYRWVRTRFVPARPGLSNSSQSTRRNKSA